MSLQMSLVFGLLVFEMSYLLLLLVPLPFAVRQKLVNGSVRLNQSKNFKSGWAFTTVMLGLQFIDCVQKLNKYHTSDGFPQSREVGTARYDQLASKFYSQRNLYITGAVLYLEVSIFTVVTILKKLVAKEESYRAATSVETGKGDSQTSDQQEEAAELRKLIKEKENDIATFRKQLEGVQRQYDSLNPAEVRSKSD
ncbi:hypothetical protein FT663_03758 [Candidozyma haemuli var. vulneris]|uniref:Endoplasmic reticulum transmembrane protein n=1 Tax=Candidozyma haemuli TaxID=45357 RepID=A0A2V1ARJ3_9ASCO|nr:hypothetical protein CXQ85_002193 [[Candida] haemuloni]KAF3989087.1 hypothetical protein FT663_03758 [[Candida] haemuloni var. vulneris]KAF3991200.1 hypothetical protein FT662_01875 [[Candida] haemuloni var. vulneris]PVH20405.1 hypothetical protein CXQ85_002193 [[Candida] haemuloni]